VTVPVVPWPSSVPPAFTVMGEPVSALSTSSVPPLTAVAPV